MICGNASIEYTFFFFFAHLVFAYFYVRYINLTKKKKPSRHKWIVLLVRKRVG